MPDMEKVVKGLTDIYDEAYDRWVHCQYNQDKLLMLIDNTIPDVLALLREKEVGGWISVKDNPPDGECIAYSKKWDEMIIGYIYESKVSDTGYEAENEQHFLRDVSHWMQKPMSPKEGNNG